MAGVLKARDAASALQTISVAKVRDAASALQTLQFVRIRDAGNTLREVFTVGGGGGGGGGGAGNPTSITPGSREYTGTAAAKSGTFAAVSSGAAPTSYTWGLLDGTGSVVAGQGTANATLQIVGTVDEPIASTFFCDMVIGGTTYRATCQLVYYRTAINKGSGSPMA